MSLNDAQVAAATSVFPFCGKRGIYFADAEVVVTRGRRRVSLRGTSLGFGRELSELRCRSELMERWAHLEWELDGAPKLCGNGMETGRTYSDLVQSGIGEAPGQLDGSGYCAGPTASTDRIWAHGLLEVIERDSVVRVLDRHLLPLHDATSRIPQSLRCLLRGQQAHAEAWIVRRPGLPPTAMALIGSFDGAAAALGTSCKYTEPDALTRAVLEGVMMLTTVRHTQRMKVRPPHMDGILWASEHSSLLGDELRAMTADRQTEGGRAPRDLSSLVAGTCASFGEEPVAVRFSTRRSRVCDIEVWRVQVPGALNPAMVERRPWPVG
ncbi:YcaO-like family protein [Streptomyces sp. NPDC051214]|uniref:YcaO-like family protein n=1 Tax=Streptomyces sp. NPDC051214 TaxID=3155282 RepID=UPI00342CEDAE